MVFFGWEDEPRSTPRKKLSKDQRVEVWNKYIGARKAEGPCYVCKRTIHISDFEVGHNVARSKGGTNNLANFRPICRTCNRAMGTATIESYKKKLNGPAVSKSAKKPSPKKKAPAKKRAPRRQTDDSIFSIFDL